MKRGLLVVVAFVALLFVPLGGVRADTTSARVIDSAWYRPPPTCVLPIGCGPTEAVPPLSTYPPGTLHVGLTLGVEDSRTYLKLDLGSLPTGAVVRGGTLSIPLADPAAGTSSAETAQAIACWVNVAFTPVEGSFAPPPSVDCSNPTPVVYVPGPPAMMTVDLANVAARWRAGETNNGLALVPAPGQGPGTTWHLAFAAQEVVATLDYEPAPAAPAADPPPIVEEPPFVDFIDDLGVIPAPVLGLAPPPASPAAPIIAQAEAPEIFEPAFVTGGPGFAYPAVMGVPLLLLVLGGYLAWALNQPVAQAES